MKYLALTLVALVLALPSAAATPDPKPPKPVAVAVEKSVPLRTRVTRLEAKVKTQAAQIATLQKNLAALKTIVCLQLPSAC